MYGLPLEKRPSHIAKLNGNHWNKGRKASIETKDKLSKMRNGSLNSRSRKTLLFDKDFNFVKEFDYCLGICDYIGSSGKSISNIARRNSKKDIPYHTTRGYYVIQKDDWDSKFKEKELEIKELLKVVRKNKNQYS